MQECVGERWGEVGCGGGDVYGVQGEGRRKWTTRNALVSYRYRCGSLHTVVPLQHSVLVQVHTYTIFTHKRII